MVKLKIDPRVLARVYGVRQATPLLVSKSAATGSASTRSLQPLDIQTDPTFSHETTPPAPAVPPVATTTPQTGEPGVPTPRGYKTHTGWVPINTPERFIELHQERDKEREAYLHHGRRNRPSLDRATRADLAERNAMLLPANNMHARVSYALITATHVQAVVDALPPGMPAFWLTLINGAHTVSLADAATFATAKVTGWVHQILRGTHYVGMVEGAFYSNLGQVGLSYHRGVSWHTHLIVWGLSELAFDEMVVRINKRFTTVIPGKPPAKGRRLSRDEVSGKALYMSKGQLAEYRVYPLRGDVVDRETGEVFEARTGEYEPKKRSLRPIDAVRMCPVFADRRIDGLAFAAGDGRVVLRAIKQEALAAFHRWEATQPYKLAEERRRAA